MNDEILMEGDRVFYTGEKFKQELSREGKPTVGWIHARIEGNPCGFIVEFDNKAGDSYVMNASSLTKLSPIKEKELGPEVQPRRKKKQDDDL